MESLPVEPDENLPAGASIARGGLPPAATTDAVFLPQSDRVLESSVGTLELGPPSFLDRWGVIFLACFGFWIIIAGSILLVFGLRSLPPDPVLTGLTADQVRDALNAHKLLTDQWRDSLTSIFDLLITKTALPLVTLLLGYLFGRGRGTAQ